MRSVLKHGGAAVRLSIAAAIVIAKPVHRQIFTLFGFADLCKEMSTKGNNSQPGGAQTRGFEGSDVAVQ
jgi:hypothetical protein